MHSSPLDNSSNLLGKWKSKTCVDYSIAHTCFCQKKFSTILFQAFYLKLSIRSGFQNVTCSPSPLYRVIVSWLCAKSCKVSNMSSCLVIKLPYLGTVRCLYSQTYFHFYGAPAYFHHIYISMKLWGRGQIVRNILQGCFTNILVIKLMLENMFLYMSQQYGQHNWCNLCGWARK